MDQINVLFNNLSSIALGNLNINKIISAIIIAVLLILSVKLIMNIVNKLIAKLNIDETLKKFIKKTIKFILYFVSILIVSDSIGIPITSLLALFSVLGLAASLAVQGFLTNIAGGVSILASKPFFAGDYVEIGGVSGSVREIGLIHTKLSTPDNKIIYVPNSEISSSKIINYSSEDKRLVVLNITASYDSKIDDVKSALIGAINDTKEIIDKDKAIIGVLNFNSSNIEYVVKAWVDTSNYWNGYYALNENIKASFDKNNIQMTYDHINVHMMDK